MEPTDDTDRVLLLAQIALEGVNLSAEVQGALSDAAARSILAASRYRNFHGLAHPRYVVSRGDVTPEW